MRPARSVLCLPGSLDPAKTAGKIVACLRGLNARLQKGQVVKDAGGVGMILGNAPANGDELLSDPHILPATHITAESMTAVQAYIASTRSVVTDLFPREGGACVLAPKLELLKARQCCLPEKKNACLLVLFQWL